MSYDAIEQAGRERTQMQDGKETATRIFIVQSATRMTGFETITGLPDRGDAWPSRSGLIAHNITATESEQISGGWLWTYKVEYRNYIDDGEDAGNNLEEVLNRAAVWSWDSDTVEETRYSDLDNKPYINTAGDPFNPPPVFSVAHPIATVTKNRATLDGGFILAYINTVNHDTYAGASRGYVRMNRISGSPKQRDGTTYYETTFVMEYNPRGWVPYYELNQGPRYRLFPDDPTKEPVFPTDTNGVISTEPVMLDEKGGIIHPAIISVGDWWTLYHPPTYTTFRQYDYQNFTALGLT